MADLPPDVARLRPELEAGARALGLALSDEQTTQLLAYLALVAKWTRVYNLTAVRDPQEMLTHHLLDSLAVVAPLGREAAALRARAADGGAAPAPNPLRLLDVGAGAGLPGVVLAICCPGVDVTCVDTVAKKAAFIQQAAGALRLPNLHGVHSRVEQLAGPFDVVCSRAFASLADFTAWSGGALAPGGVWLAMKGKHPADELAALPPTVSVFHVEPLTVPGLDAERCIVWMRRAV
ncbi:MAG: 16S rRNA (guanine(527)-N(7))-methyltransferase RsmG [Burkholderiaceae bacterium]